MRTHQPCHNQTVSCCQSEKSLLTTSLYPWCSFNEIPRKCKLKKIGDGLKPIILIHRWIVHHYCLCVMSCCWLHLSAQEVSAFCISPVSFCDNINHTPMFCPFFFFCFLFLHLSWACSAVFLPCLSLAVLWQLLKGCLSWGTDPRTKTRPRPSTGAPCVRSPLAVMLIFHCLHSLPSCQYGDIPKEKSLISAELQYETDSNYFRFLSQLLNSGLKSFFWNYRMSKYFWLISTHLHL